MRVLIAGGGTVGSSAALFLAHHDVDVLVVDPLPGPSAHPRATGLGLRTMEMYREVGIEAAVNAVAVDAAGASLGKISAVTLARADLPDVPPAPARQAWERYAALSPARVRGTVAQDRLDRVLLHESTARGAAVRW